METGGLGLLVVDGYADLDPAAPTPSRGQNGLDQRFPSEGGRVVPYLASFGAITVCVDATCVP
jgi:hypothetical protein